MLLSEKYGLMWENGNTDETVVLLSQQKADTVIQVRENYNLPKLEDRRQPPCPAKKEKAIKDALEYFGML